MFEVYLKVENVHLSDDGMQMFIKAALVMVKQMT